MRFDQDHESPDIIDRRGEPRGFGGGSGMGMLALLPLLGRSRFGWLIILVLVGLSVVGGLVGTGGGEPDRVAQTQTTGAGDPKHFVAFVLDDTQQTWNDIFARNGRQYRKAKLVLYTDATQTACGAGQAATGPFYCPSDERVYIDLGFYDELAHKFGAAGDFAQAYVIAHEIGHHVQKLLGIDKSHGASKGAESASVRLELQADCFAGVWAHSTEQRKLLDPGDTDEALRAASAVGDDRLQRASGRTIHPESFTHGTAAQRATWLKRGLAAGTVDACDTFGASSL
jgi:predicted metalloprotease